MEEQQQQQAQVQEMKTTNENVESKELDTQEHEIRGTGVAGKFWKHPGSKASTRKTNALKTSFDIKMKEKQRLNEMKKLEMKIKADIEEERKTELRKIEQRRQAKIEKKIKEQMHKPQKQSSLKKNSGKNKILRSKDWKRVRSLKQFDPELNSLK